MPVPRSVRARIHEMREKHLTPSRIAKATGVPLANVRAVLGLPDERSLSDARKLEIRSQFERGMTLRQIAATYQISMTTATRACKGLSRSDDEAREARSRGAKRSTEVQAQRRRAQARVLAARVFLAEEVEVPGWVPSQLRDVYERVGMLRGEHEAAAVVRKLKASGSVACR